MMLISSIFLVVLALRSGESYSNGRYVMMKSNNFFSNIFNPVGTTKSRGLKATEVLEIKNGIKSISRGKQNGIKCIPAQRVQISTFVSQLEDNNPTKDISSSLLLNGEWKLVYTTNEGSSAGKLGPFVGTVSQKIDFPKKSYINKVSLFNNLVTGVLGATWLTKSKSLWLVQFQDIVVSLGGIKLVEKSLKGTEGTWRNTYLDENFRILYAIGGKNTIKENVYILEKKV